MSDNQREQAELSDHFQALKMDSNAPAGSRSADWQSARELSQDPTTLELRASLDHAHYNIEQLHKQMMNLEAKQTHQAKTIDKLSAAYQDLQDYTADLEDYILSVDVSSRKKNLIITGLDENLNETSETIIVRLFGIFSNYVDTLERSDFDLAYRIGKPPKNRNKGRPILVKMHRENARNAIAQVKFQLDDEAVNKNVYLNDDLPKVINERRSLMCLVVKEAKTRRIPAKLSGNKLMVNNLTYEYKNLDCLPKGLRPEDIKMKEYGDTIAFHSEHSWLSNFFTSPFDLQGLSFVSGEQAYQYAKACRNNELDQAALIMKTNSPKEAKKLGAGVTPNRKWDTVKEEIMRRIISAKFAKNPLLRTKLMETGTKRLVEATTDPYWGASATITSKSIQEDKWKGANRYGILLMEYREELLRVHSIEQMKSSPAAVTGATQNKGNNNARRNKSTATSLPQPEAGPSTQSAMTVGACQQSIFEPDQVTSTPKKASDAPPPLPPRSKKRGADSLSPLGSTSVIRQKASSPSETNTYSVSRQRSFTKSPVSTNIVPPIGDLFACDTDTDELSSEDQVNERDFTVIIGSQPI